MNILRTDKGSVPSNTCTTYTPLLRIRAMPTPGTWVHVGIEQILGHKIHLPFHTLCICQIFDDHDN